MRSRVASWDNSPPYPCQVGGRDGRREDSPSRRVLPSPQFWWIIEKMLWEVLPFPVLLAGFGAKLQTQPYTPPCNTHTGHALWAARFRSWKLPVGELMTEESKTSKESKVRRRKVRNELENIRMGFLFRKEHNPRAYWIKSLLRYIVSTSVEASTSSAKLVSSWATWVLLGMHPP